MLKIENCRFHVKSENKHFSIKNSYSHKFDWVMVVLNNNYFQIIPILNA